jgi:4-aminobutyrate aminotransferase-like enzyme/Ser/Thr protein kinase RdoA (MazF antagonist)
LAKEDPVEKGRGEVAEGPVLHDPLRSPLPDFSIDDAERIAATEFGVVGVASPLVSERDQNFRIAVESGPGWVLKVSNAAEDPGVFDMQTEAMLHVAGSDPALPVMRIHPAVSGGSSTSIGDAEGRSHLVRMVTFMPGRQMDADELGLDAVRAFGVCAARLGRALRGFFHPSAGHRLLWNLRHALELREFLTYVGEPDRRRIVERVLDRFEEHVQPVFGSLRAQVIHNDVTLDNTVLDRRQRIVGVLDLGDMAHTATICDLVATAEPLVGERPDHFEALAAVVSGFHAVTPLLEEEVDVLPELLLARWTTSAVISAWRSGDHPNADYISSWDAGAWTMLTHFDEVGIEEWRSEIVGAVLRGTGDSPRAAIAIGDLIDRRRRLLGAAISPLSYEHPVHLVKANGAWMFDADGRAYLDAYNNVPVVGHSHPHVTDAVSRQTRTLNTNTRYAHGSILELAERLIATLPQGLDTALFVNSGSEANDLAWRLATSVTGQTGGLVTEFAYHGVTAVIADLSPETWREGAAPHHVATMPAPDGFRGPFRADEQGWDARYAEQVDIAIATLKARGIGPAAMFIDAAFTSDGIFTPPVTYLQGVLERWRDAGGLFVADEVQTGFGRPGSHLWGFQVHEVVPDIVTLGKPMGNGYPVAAVITRADIVDRFARQTEWFSTFGGNPVACEASLAVLDVLEDEALPVHATEIGERLRAGLTAIAERHVSIGEVRSLGLLIGVDLVIDRSTREPATELASRVVNGMRDRGVLMGTTGRSGNVLKIRPPLVISAEEADLLVERLDDVLGSLSTREI